MIKQALARAISEAAVAKLASYSDAALAKSIFVTGMSGAGKSTVSQELSRRYGFPVVSTDDYPGIRAIMKTLKDPGSTEDMMQGDNTEFLNTLRPVMENFLKGIKEPHIIEGAFLMETPELIPGAAKKILIQAPEDLIKERRFQRELQKRIAKGKDVGPEKLEDMRAFTNILTDYYRPYMQAFAKMPGVEIIDNSAKKIR